jgi:hypothetical protein
MTTALKVRISVWVWLLAALWAGQQQLLARLPAPAGPGLIVLLSAAVLVCYFRTTNFRAWVDGLDLRSLVVLHVTRFVGFYFLLLYRRGELPYAFAVPGGWGDILTALLAGLICFVPLKPALRRRAITIWNAIGFVDLLLVVSTAGRLLVENRAQLRALTYLPLSLLPTFLVPLLIATHVIIYLRLRREQAAA